MIVVGEIDEMQAAALPVSSGVQVSRLSCNLWHGQQGTFSGSAWSVTVLRQPPVMLRTLAWLSSMILGTSHIATPQPGPVSGVITKSHSGSVAKMRRMVHCC